jgi:hypothetical protein
MLRLACMPLHMHRCIAGTTREQMFPRQSKLFGSCLIAVRISLSINTIVLPNSAIDCMALSSPAFDYTALECGPRLKRFKSDLEDAIKGAFHTVLAGNP